MPRIISSGYGLVILGASFWGLTGLFVQNLYTYGLYPIDVVAVRMAVSGLIMIIILAPSGRRYFSIKRKDLIYFFSLGVLTIGFFNLCYFSVMERANLSVAVIFVYTSPGFAMVFAKLFFKEHVTLPKMAAILITFAGCGFVVGFFPGGKLDLSILTIVLGLLSGIFASLFSIIGKYVSSVYHPVTVTTYAMLCGAVVMIPLSGIWKRSDAFLQWEIWALIAGLVLISTVMAYTLYTLGLMYIESSKAAILSTFELLVSISVGVLVFHDKLTGWQWIGAAMVIGSIFITILSKEK